jgi:hypothetical protein
MATMLSSHSGILLDYARALYFLTDWKLGHVKGKELKQITFPVI